MATNIRHNPVFHPRVNAWFAEQVGKPTPIQKKAWPLIYSDRHVLITAPTGSGKTLAAFLWALNELIVGRWEAGDTRILYVSPLKALNNDIQKNLILPLTQLRQVFEEEGCHFPSIRVMTRSGDTPSGQRRNMIRRPPEILITTPESLHLMLSSHGGRSILGDIKTVIMDEIHAVVGNKRGTLLISAVDRLVLLAGEFQRIALSATVNPVRTVMDFIGGYRIEGDFRDPVYRKRSVEHCHAGSNRKVDIEIRLANAVIAGHQKRSIWADMADEFRRIIEANQSTIIFVNSRRLCEKLTFLINADRPDPIAYSHHGSLSKELRLEVEQRLKKGKLKAIVATASLELGIDIGSLDHVILVQSPPSVTSAVQRIGRSGHGVGETSSATIVPTHATDLLTAAVLARTILDEEIEPVRPVICPLDVLAQVLIAMVGISAWNVDDLYFTVRTSYPFHDLQRTAYDLVTKMLAGRYADTRIRSLSPKIALDRIDHTVTARKGALLSLYTSGGVIPDRGYFALRHVETGARIGELDEEFVWEAKKGQVFTLGTQNWKVDRITHNDVFVRPANPKTPAPPFWRAEDADRDFHLSDKIARFLENAQHQGSDGRFLKELTTDFHMDEAGARFLIDFLQRQQKKTGSPLPHRHHVVVERMPSEKGEETVSRTVIHTLWGGRVNRPFALALEAAWKSRYGYTPTIFPTNDAVYLLLPDDADAGDIMTLVNADTVESLLRKSLEGSGTFGARFRECAARALLLPRKNFNQRMPLWLTRQKSQKLLDALGQFSDFPILLETWRTCLKDDFDIPALKKVLKELENGEILCSEAHTRSPSPMALSGSWRMINQYMYGDDRQQGEVKTGLSGELLQQVVFSPQLRPAMDPAAIEAFTEKRQRLHLGYAPVTSLELLEWVKERILIPMDEWNRLLEHSANESGKSKNELLEPIHEKLLEIVPKAFAEPDRCLIVAAESALTVAKGLYDRHTELRWTTLAGKPVQPFLFLKPELGDYQIGAMELLSQWLGYYGPVTEDFISDRLVLDKNTVFTILSALMETQSIISGTLVRGQDGEAVCDAENFETLLRIARRMQIPEIIPRDLTTLTPVLARYQKIFPVGNSIECLVDCLQPLIGYSLPAILWETEILPARLPNYDPRWMDRLIHESGLMWVGGVKQKILFSYEEDLDLIGRVDAQNPEEKTSTDKEQTDFLHLFPDRRGRYTLTDLSENSQKAPHHIRQWLWKGAWAGIVTNDSMISLRQESGKGSKKPGTTVGRPLSFPVSSPTIRRRHRWNGRKNIEPSSGTWRMITYPGPPVGMIEEEELSKDRVRLLLDRYGILFRQLLEKELPVFQWSAVFRSLRLMELSGEVIGGYFFTGIPGLQFVSKRMLRLLQEKQSEDFVFWINAQDPVSLCGLGLDALKGRYPHRLTGTHLVFLGRRLSIISQKKGRVLTIHLPVEHPRLAECLGLFDHFMKRRINPPQSITVERINGGNAAQSPFLEVFKQRFDLLVEANGVVLYRTL